MSAYTAATARPGRRRGARLLGFTAVALAVLASTATSPAAAQTAPATVERRTVQVFHTGGTGQANRVGIFVEQNGEIGYTDAAPIVAGAGCRQADTNVVLCGTGVGFAFVNPSDNDDVVVPQAPQRTLVQGGEGNDTLEGGQVPGTSQVAFEGQAGLDTISYGNADRFVTVTLDGLDNDGRPGDRDFISPSVETVLGSRFPDRITGATVDNVIDGGRGSDILSGLGGNDRFNEGTRSSDADTISGGTDADTVDYGARTTAIGVTLNAVADDGQAGEGDNVAGDTENAFTGSGADTLVGNGAGNSFIANGGDDRLTGKGGADRLDGRDGADTYLGGPGNDILLARDGARDSVNCGAGVDSAVIDPGIDAVTGCETVR